jgi:hypothetical protein
MAAPKRIVSVTDVASRFASFGGEAGATGSDRGGDVNGCVSALRRDTTTTRRAVALALAQERMTPARRAVQRHLGMRQERDGLTMYEHSTGRRVLQRNARTLTLALGGGLVLVGRVDGVRDDGVVVEHKRRVRGLVGYVPQHERMQCVAYMHMLGADRAHLVETFGEHMRVHEVAYDAAVWREMLERVEQLVSADGIVPGDGAGPDDRGPARAPAQPSASSCFFFSGSERVVT